MGYKNPDRLDWIRHAYASFKLKPSPKKKKNPVFSCLVRETKLFQVTLWLSSSRELSLKEVLASLVNHGL